MEWTEALRRAIAYMEKHLLEPITPEDVAAHVFMSPFYFQKGFEIVTGCSVSRYLRSRRLYLAALDLAAGKGRVIDIAYRYGFETPESFTKAFSRFHGATPSQIKADNRQIKTFLPLKITVSVQGGAEMEYTVERMNGFQVIGFQREFFFESAHREIPKFWEEFSSRYLGPLFSGKEPETPEEEAVCRHRIGEFGVCIDDGIGGRFRYLIAGAYQGGPAPEGMTLFSFPDLEWAKFPCQGSMPGALQSVNAQIFNEWLPGNGEYRIAMDANIEWYAPGGDTDCADYEAAIWVPVERL